MIKLGGTTKSGRKMVILGLSEGNVMALRQKRPIVIYGTEVNVPEMEVLIIHWGETEDDLQKEFERLIDDRTRVTDHRREKKQ